MRLDSPFHVGVVTNILRVFEPLFICLKAEISRRHFQEVYHRQLHDLVPGTNLEIRKIIIVRYQDYRSVFKPEVEFTISVDNFDSEVEELKIALSGK